MAPVLPVKVFTDMNLSESYKKRLKSLSGIRLTEVELKAVSGRSEKGTLSFYVEEYILNVGETFLNALKERAGQDGSVSKKIIPNTIKISQNSLLIPFEVIDDQNPEDVQKTNFSLSISVNLESDSNTMAVLKYGTLNDEFNLQSKHSQKDVSDFVNEMVNRVLNVQKTSG